MMVHVDYSNGKDSTVVQVNGRRLNDREFKVNADGVLTLMLCECTRHICSGKRLDNSLYCNHCFLEGHDLLNQFAGPMQAR